MSYPHYKTVLVNCFRSLQAALCSAQGCLQQVLMFGWCRYRWGRRCFTCRTTWARNLVTYGKVKGSSEPCVLPVWVSQVLYNITHMHEIRAFPMVWGGRGYGMRLELKIFPLKEFLFLSTKHCHWCCQFAWTGGDKIPCLGTLWHHSSQEMRCGEGSFQGLRGAGGGGWSCWCFLCWRQREAVLGSSWVK